MEAWVLDIPAGTVFMDISLMGLLLVAATMLRRWVRPLQTALIPNNLTAGVIGLLLGMNGLGLLDLTSERLGAYVYHLVAILFIALGLRAPRKEVGRSSFGFGVIFILTYLVQGIVGLLLAFGLIHTVMPDLFPGIGVMLPLGFGMNPGIAYTIGKNWEAAGFTDGGIVGLSFAAAGFVVAYTVGLHVTRRYARERGDAMASSSTGILDRPDDSRAGSLTTSPDVIESFAFHTALIGACYALLIAILTGLEHLLAAVGAEKEISTLWSFHFVLAPILAMGVRSVVDRLGASQWIDDTTMTRTGNMVMDFMIVASVAAISFRVVADYLAPLLILSVAVGAASWYLIRSLIRQGFDTYREERLITVFGNLTGTLQSGLVLLRVLDPDMKTPASYNLVYGSGVALGFGLPLMVLINLPVHYTEDLAGGYWIVLAGMAAYLAIMWGVWRWGFVRRRG